jgi:prepilin-type N-terminal cleavage/methylation domain-containing protein
MNKTMPGGRFQRTAFTLIELLVVIAVIGILAGLVLTIMPALGKNKTISTATAELKEVETAIEAYKSKLGFYPPDNPNNANINPLYFELVGTIFTNDTTRGGWGYVTLDNNTWIVTNDVFNIFRVSGFANSASSIRGDDDRAGPINFLKDFRNMERRVGATPASNPRGKVLLCSIGWDRPGAAASELCTWRYNSSHPTNSPNTYDLWVNLYLSDKTNRISNWSKKPQIVND